MAIAPVRIARLQSGIAIVDSSGIATAAFLRTINDALGQIENALNGVIAAQNAAEAASAAAGAAQHAAEAAQTSADNAALAAGGNGHEAALVNSYISPSTVVSATKTLISVAAHVRYYADGTNVSVDAGTVATTGLGDYDNVWYIDAARTGGAVTYHSGTDGPAQGNDVHAVGSVLVPTGAGSVTGDPGPSKPGYG